MSLFPNRSDISSGVVECLGQTFPSEDARRQHFLDQLRTKLADPVFRKIEGFPIGTDDDILALSDPPYFTACPNPFIPEFIKHYGKPYDTAGGYSREPLTVDVQEGKGDALYKAHGYHTKVPHLAIVPSILHYTEPGDLVLDGFCGSGMTGVAAQWCGSAPPTHRAQLEAEWKAAGRKPATWGARRVVLNDLSPAAAFIAANYNIPFDLELFAAAGRSLLDEVGKHVGWMYETDHTDGTKGRIDYTVWSEVFACPSCAGEVVFSEHGVDQTSQRIFDLFPCPHCGVELTKKTLQRSEQQRFDSILGKVIKEPRRKAVLVVYQAHGKRQEKVPDAADMARLEEIRNLPWPADLPHDRMMHAPESVDSWGDKWRAGTASFTHVHHLFLPRAAHAVAELWRRAKNVDDVRLRNQLLFFAEQAIVGMTVLARYVPTHFSQVNQYLTGVYYVASQHAECSPWYILDGKLARLSSAFRQAPARASQAIVNVGSAAAIPLPAASIDYIFTDPPFGDNLAYAELNFVVEAFHRVISNIGAEAIMSGAQDKGLHEYQGLMRRCFAEYHRVLKPGRWMTVVFSNTQAAVWNAIQTALQEAGFVVANVSALDKKQGSFNAVTNATSVKQDLVISAYKPNGGLEDRFVQAAGNEDSSWDFVRTHLKYLPTVKLKEGQLEFIAERDPRIIFDRMVAFFIRHNFPVPLSSQEFQYGLSQRFSERDGMVFLPDQVNEYDRKRMQTASAPQMELFISDERSAIDWLTDFLRKKPSTYQELHPEFIKQLGAGWKKHEAKPELSELLEGNFLRYDQKSKESQDVPAQIHSYLSSNWATLRNLDKSDARLKTAAADRWFVPDPTKAQELEKVREKSLLKEFETYKAHTGRKLKEFRLEVMRTGFKTCWGNRDYATIIAVAKKVPDDVLQEDEKLLLWYDQALTRMEEA